MVPHDGTARTTVILSSPGEFKHHDYWYKVKKHEDDVAFWKNGNGAIEFGEITNSFDYPDE